MRAPAFWWTPHATLASRLLAPAGAILGAVTVRRMAGPGLRLPVPVICIGNLVVGGAGKTPVALAIGRLLRAEGRRPAFISRGYGRARASQPAVLAVDPDRHTARDTGDEPLLLARVAPTFVSINRPDAARAALAGGADVLILDDGLQNPALAKDLVIAVADGATGHGNGLCLPAGPLRAPASAQWPHVSALCVVGPGAAGRSTAAAAAQAGVATTTASLRPDPEVVARLTGRRLIAFAGIGRPAKFFETLDRAGLDVVDRRAFADHHPFTASDLEALRRLASDSGATLVTTAKDRMRLPRDAPAEVVPVELVFSDPAWIGLLLHQLFTDAVPAA